MTTLWNIIWDSEIHNLEVVVCAGEFSFPSPYNFLAETYWEKKIAHACQNGYSLRDAPKFHVQDTSISFDTWWTIQVTYTYYRHIVYKEVLLSDPAWGTIPVPRCLFVAWFFETTDSYMVFGVRWKKHTPKKSWFFTWIGGMIEPYSVPDTQWDHSHLFDHCMLEFREEVWYSWWYIGEPSLLGLVETAKHNVWAVCYFKLDQDSQQIQKQFEKYHDGELGQLLFVKKEDVYQYLLDLPTDGEQKAHFAKNFCNI